MLASRVLASIITNNRKNSNKQLRHIEQVRTKFVYLTKELDRYPQLNCPEHSKPAATELIRIINFFDFFLAYPSVYRQRMLIAEPIIQCAIPRVILKLKKNKWDHYLRYCIEDIINAMIREYANLLYSMKMIKLSLFKVCSVLPLVSILASFLVPAEIHASFSKQKHLNKNRSVKDPYVDADETFPFICSREPHKILMSLDQIYMMSVMTGCNFIKIQKDPTRLMRYLHAKAHKMQQYQITYDIEVWWHRCETVDYDFNEWFEEDSLFVVSLSKGILVPLTKETKLKAQIHEDFYIPTEEEKKDRKQKEEKKQLEEEKNHHDSWMDDDDPLDYYGVVTQTISEDVVFEGWVKQYSRHDFDISHIVVKSVITGRRYRIHRVDDLFAV